MKKNRHACNVLGALLLGLIPASGEVILYQAEFNTNGDLEGWTDGPYGAAPLDRLKEPGYDGTTITGQEQVVGGALVASAIGNDPQFKKTGLNINADYAGKVVMRYRVSDGVGGWAVPAADICVVNAASQLGSTTAPNSLVADVDGWYLATWDITDVTGVTITSLRVDPIVWSSAPATSPEVQVDYIRVLQVDNLPPTAELDPVAAIGGEYALVQEWDWNTDGDLDGWNLTNFTVNLPDDVSGSLVTGTSTSGDAQMASPVVSIPVSDTGRMIIEIGVETDGVAAGPHEIYWDDQAGGWAQIRHLNLPDLPADSATHVVRIEFDDDIVGVLEQFRYDPNKASGVVSKIDYIRVYSDTTAIGWDIDPGTAGVQGGSGTWDTATANWIDGSLANTIWPSLSSGNDDAIFGVLGGTVTIDTGGVTANDVTFNVDGYTLDGDTLTLDGAVSRVSAGTGANVVIDAALSRTGTANTDRLLISGPGSFDLGGGGAIDRKWHFSTDTTLTGGVFDSSGNANGSNGMVVFNDATLTIAGATLNRVNFDADDALYIGSPSTTDADFTTGTSLGAMVVETGSSVDVSGGRGIVVGFGNNPSTNLLTVNGGDVVSSAIHVGWNSTGVLELNGGTLTVNGEIRHADSGAGSQLHLNAGATLAADMIRNSSNLEGFEVYLNGGTLKPTIDAGTLISIGDKSVETSVYLSAAGAVIDTDGNSTTITAALQNKSGDNGALTKQGAGTLALSGLCDYTGTTGVQAGTLLIDGDSSSATGDVTVASGATLGGGGVIGGVVTVNSGGSLAPGSPADSSLTGIADITINGSFAIAIDGANSTRLDLASNTLDITNATLAVSVGAAPTAPFYVIAYYGSLTGAQFAGLSGVPAGYTVDYNYLSGDQIALVQSGGNDYDTWSGSQAWTPGDPGTAAGEDYDGDGLSNDQERAFGLVPTSGASVSPIVSGLSVGGGFQYTRRDITLTGLTYTIETSTDLATWTVDAGATAGQSAGTPDGNDVETVTVTLTASPVNGRLFTRVAAR